MTLCFIQFQLTVDVNAPIDPTECGKSKGCFRSPGQCVVNNCRYFLTWRLNNSTGTVDFEYSANTTEQTPWIALGFSNDTKMVKMNIYHIYVLVYSKDINFFYKMVIHVHIYVFD